MADHDDKDWTRDSTHLIHPGSFGDEVESEEEDYGDDYDDDGGGDNNDDDDDVAKTGLACPFCFENFDALGLCCHIDVEHHREAKTGICPVCGTKVEINIVAHLITQHHTFLKLLCKWKIHKHGSLSALSIFKKESQDEQFHSYLKESSASCFDSSSNSEPDCFLSFIYNRQPLQKLEITRPSSEARLRCNSDIDTLESGKDIETSTLPDKDQEGVQRREFVHGLLFSTIFNDDL